MARDDSPFIVFLTCAVSHIAIIPTILQLYRRHWMWETFVFTSSMLCSFMYHACQSINIRAFLTELQWHRLDNIFAIAGFAQLFVYFANIANPRIEFYLKASGLLMGIIVQETDPWNVLYTVVPILLYGMIPLISLVTWNRNVVGLYDRKNLAFGCGAFFCAVPFFVLGLDDDNDPWRIFHGTWHIVGSLASLYLWRAVRAPQAISLQSIVTLDSVALLEKAAKGRIGIKIT